MPRDASELAQRLAREAEAVCRHYLSSGRREGRYWLVGDARNTPGRSMFVRLKGPASGRGAAGKWTDAATGEHGDLLDVIRESCGLLDFSDVADEARRFLRLPRSDPEPASKPARIPAQTGSPEAARRLFAMSQPIARTLAERYLRDRGITALHDGGSLRFHPRCYYRPDDGSPTETWPAMIARVTDLDGRITGSPSHLARSRRLRCSSVSARRRSTPRGARWATSSATRSASVWRATCSRPAKASRPCCPCAASLPTLPMAAALSANHLAAMLLPLTLRRLYIARDADAAGDAAATALTERAEAAGIEALRLSPRLGDFNEDLRAFGVDDLRAALRIQLAPQDVVRFILWATAETG